MNGATATMAEKFDPLAMDMPENLQTVEFREAWEMWAQHRREKKCSLTPTSAKLQLKKFSKYGPDIAIQAIEQAIEKGWQGCFPEKIQTPASAQSSVDEWLASRQKAEPQSIIIPARRIGHEHDGR